MKQQKSHYEKPLEVKRQWVLIDAQGEVLGRLASRVAMIARGKNKVTYTPSVDNGDFVVIINADKIKVTGNKLKDKRYYWHTGYAGGIKSISLQDQLKKDSTKVLYDAIKGMIPGTKLGKQVLKKVKIYSGSSHPHAPQNPVSVQG